MIDWPSLGIRPVLGVFGIYRDRDHWRCFDDAGDYVGKFADPDAARSGCWVPEAEANHINAERLITIEDVRQCMRQAMSKVG